MEKNPKLKDVADKAGVSPTTASLVLNDKATGIPTETRDRVFDASAELGYQPNALARSLRTNSTDTIGFVSDDVATTPFAGQMIQGAQDAAWKAGKLLLMVNTGGDTEVEQRAVDELLRRQVDGIIYSAMYHQVVTPPEAIRRVPSVLLDARCDDGSISSVVPDEFGGAYAAVAALVEAGHTRIGFLQNSDDIPAAHERLEGFRSALAAHDIDPDRVPIEVTSATGTSLDDAATERLLAGPDRPTAVFCFNDRMASHVYRVAATMGLSVPEDLSVIGFDNQELLAPWLVPGLTSMQLPHYEMGKWAVERLLTEISEDSREAVQHRMPCPIVERQSVASPRKPLPKQRATK